MRWRGNRQSSNVEDRRGMRASRVGGLGGGGGMIRLIPVVFKFLGFKGTVLVVLAVLIYGYYSGNLEQILGGGSFTSNQQASSSSQPLEQSAQEKELAAFISVVLADTEDTWHSLFEEQQQQYKEPKACSVQRLGKFRLRFWLSTNGPFLLSSGSKGLY